MAVLTRRDYFNKINPSGSDADFQKWLSESNSANDGSVWFDDDYLSEIEEYKNSPYYKYLLTNPWLAGNQRPFSPNFWQSIGESLGDTSARDSYYANLQSKRSEWLADALDRFRQEEYNSPLAQVERERIAGLNPDLNGSISAGSASENDQPIQGVDMPNSDLGSVPQLFSLGNTILTSAMQFASAFQSIRGNSIENRMRSLNLTDSLKSSVWSAISDGTGEFLNTHEDFDSSQIISNFEPLSKAIINRIERLPYSRRNKKQMISMVNDLVFATDSDGSYSPSVKYQTMVNDLLSNLSKSRNDFARSYASPGGEFESPKNIRWISNNIYKPIEDINAEVLKLMSKYNKSYYSSASGSLKADAENTQYRFQSDLMNVKDRLVSAFERINKRITGSKDLSPLAKLALEAGVSSAEALVFSKLQIK